MASDEGEQENPVLPEQDEPQDEAPAEVTSEGGISLPKMSGAF